MMKTTIPIILFVFSMLFISCGEDNPASQEPDPDDPDLASQEIGANGGNIISKDQLLTLTIPEGALGNTESITIREISSDDLGSEFDQIVSEVGVDKVYELGPDGLAFNSPITVSFKSSQSPVQKSDSIGAFAEFLFTSANGILELLGNQQIESNFVDGTVTINAELVHFSPLVTSQANNGVSFFVFDVPESMKVGDTFTANAQIHESLAGPLGDVVSITGQASYKDKSGSPIEPTFSPTTQDIPESTEDGGYDGNFVYTCSAPGIGVYSSELSVRVRFDLDSGPVFATSYAPFITTITCEEAPPPMFTLTVEKEGNGLVKTEDEEIDCGEGCSEEYTEGTGVTLMAIPDDGWAFVGWEGDVPEDCMDSTDVCTVTMDQDRTVKAIFQQQISNLILDNLKVCIEHGTGSSKILWLFVLEELWGNGQLTLVMRIYLPPNGDAYEDVEIKTLQEFQKILFELDIYSYGNFDWEIITAIDEATGQEVDLEGELEGTVEVDSDEQNTGECD